MLLKRDQAQRFFKLHHALMCFVNLRLQIVPDVDSPDRYALVAPEMRHKVRQALLEQPQLLDDFVEANPFDLTPDDLETVRSWRHWVAGKFFVFRYLQKYAVFLKVEQPAVAYGVLALAQPFEEMVGPYLPVWVETVLLPFEGQIVYDGLMNLFSISFGPGIRRSLNEDYKDAKARLGIVTCLPIQDLPIRAKQPRKAAKPARVKSQDVRETLQQIVGLTDRFCGEHLNDEYATACRMLAEKLARKRPSPLLSGHPNAWACGIVRTIGMVNFLDDRSQTPHMRMTDVDAAFGVGQSTGQGKSKQIRTMLKIRQFDPQWTLPSRLDDNPLIWMLQVNGFFMDIRDCPREAQVVAFEKGLIPYIPADREVGVEAE